MAQSYYLCCTGVGPAQDKLSKQCMFHNSLAKMTPTMQRIQILEQPYANP